MVSKREKALRTVSLSLFISTININYHLLIRLSARFIFISMWCTRAESIAEAVFKRLKKFGFSLYL